MRYSRLALAIMLELDNPQSVFYKGLPVIGGDND
ncbi:hypothetical protein tloyanaT_13350 [Thalassotalea loyana]|uniref:Uncharacterized protein n=1 Tax=Thalassotalea loyana TaxID=280483 RepID=A0ABQ6HAD8_9GAMM|nr:hypothetical protein tloyanaT_13350 [Thalassotalea loyana]